MWRRLSSLTGGSALSLESFFFFSRLNYSVKKESGVKAAESCVPLVPRLLLSLLSGYSLRSACCATCLHKPLPQPAAPFLCSGAWQTPGWRLTPVTIPAQCPCSPLFWCSLNLWWWLSLEYDFFFYKEKVFTYLKKCLFGSSLWDLSSLTRVRTCVPYIGSTES